MRCTRLESLDRRYLNPIRWLPSVRSVPTSLRASDIPIRCIALLLYGSRSYIPRRGVQAFGSDRMREFLQIRRPGLYSGIHRSWETHVSQIPRRRRETYPFCNLFPQIRQLHCLCSRLYPPGYSFYQKSNNESGDKYPSWQQAHTSRSAIQISIPFSSPNSTKKDSHSYFVYNSIHYYSSDQDHRIPASGISA
jgi:hypothetical protein